MGSLALGLFSLFIITVFYCYALHLAVLGDPQIHIWIQRSLVILFRIRNYEFPCNIRPTENQY